MPIKDLTRRFETQRAYRERNVEKCVYYHLKSNAKRRGIPFTITFKYFLKFAIRTGYIDKRGREASSMTVDRIKPHLGYVPGNLRAITLSENVKLQRKLEWHQKINNNTDDKFHWTLPVFEESQKVVHL